MILINFKINAWVCSEIDSDINIVTSHDANLSTEIVMMSNYIRVNVESVTLSHSSMRAVRSHVRARVLKYLIAEAIDSDTA